MRQTRSRWPLTWNSQDGTTDSRDKHDPHVPRVSRKPSKIPHARNCVYRKANELSIKFQQYGESLPKTIDPTLVLSHLRQQQSHMFGLRSYRPYSFHVGITFDGEGQPEFRQAPSAQSMDPWFHVKRWRSRRSRRFKIVCKTLRQLITIERLHTRYP